MKPSTKTSFFGSTLLLGMCFSMPPGSAIAAASDLRTDDAALVHHIKATDFVFRTLLTACRNESLRRSVNHGSPHFIYEGTCAIKPPTEEDCQFYQVAASGTVDTSTWATVRELQLKLICSG